MLVEARFRSGEGLDFDLLDRAIELEQGTQMPLMDRPSIQAAIGIGLGGRHRESIGALQAAIARAEREDDWGYLPTQVRSLAWIAWCTGDFELASAAGMRAIEVADELGLEDAGVWGHESQVLAAIGEGAAARAWAERGLATGRRLGYWWWEYRNLGALLFLELTEDNADAAAAVADRVAAIGRQVGERQPGWQRTAGDVIEAMLGVGRVVEAEELTASLEERASLSGHPWTRLAAARCRGLLESRAGRLEEALACLERALAADERGEMAFERARTLLAKGQTLRRANRRREARQSLEAARALFERCGSPPWAAKAAAELASIGGRTAHRDELTPSEGRVAELVSAGRSNCEIAQELFLSVRTVESHLSSAYRKLGVQSRTALAAALRRS
jgi:DNA-binding CsgD family transcriptional regulator